MNDTAPRRVMRFGPFELDSDSGELRKHGLKVRLQTKPLQILQAILESPNAVVTREELRRRLWQEDTFVDFESGLNTAINRLRLALGDSAENSRYIETVARSGYRFIAPVQDSHGTATVETVSPPPPPIRKPRRWWAWLIPGVTVATVLTTYFLLRPPPSEVNFVQLTFRRGQVMSARFAPEGKTVLFTAQWEHDPRQLFQMNSVSPESRSLGFRDLNLAAVSRQGELALLAGGGTANINGSDLFRVPLNGGAPLLAERNIMAADWSPDGRQFALVRATKGLNQLEYPVGKRLYTTAGWLNHVRVAPRGGLVAFLHHPIRHDDRGGVLVADSAGKVTALSDGWASISGMAWYPSSGEIWFTASRDGTSRSVWAVTTAGKLRLVAQAPGTLVLRDIASDGSVLLGRETRRLEMAGRIDGEQQERTLSWLDWSRVQEISAGGKLVLFDESGDAVGQNAVAYLHSTADRSTLRLGPGMAMGISPDGGSVLLLASEDRAKFRLTPVSGGPSRELRANGLVYQWARFFRDGKRLLALANEPGHGLRLWVLKVEADGSRPVAITPEMAVRNVAVSPDGLQVAVLSGDGALRIYPTEPGEPRVIPTEEPMAPLRWSQDGSSLLAPALAYIHRNPRPSFPDPQCPLPPWRSFFSAESALYVGHAQSLPAPTVDRVGFPEGYRDTYTLLETVDNFQNRQIRAIWANPIAASLKPEDGWVFPYGSIILFESYTVKQDDKQEPILDENGRFMPNTLTTIFVMRKEKGFGEDYKDLRNGEWEYVAYNPDKSYNTTPQNSGACARCHLSGAGLAISPESKNIGARLDYVLRAQQMFAGASGALPGAVLQQYLFVPQTIQAKSGTVLTILNDDDLTHRIVADDGSWDSGLMTTGSSLTLKLEGDGEVPVHCTIHSRMKGKIVVAPADSVPASIGGRARSSMVWSGRRLDRSHPAVNR